MVRLTDLDVGRLSWRKRRLEEWLGALPLAEPARALQQLAHSVRALNKTVTEPSVRVSLLGCYEESIRNLAATLRRPGVPADRIAFLTLVNSEMAHGYEMAIGLGGRPDVHARAALGALVHLGEVVRCAYRSYLPVPPGLWRRIHALYGSVEPETDGAIDAAYKGIILLGLADPYALAPGAIDLVTALIAQVGGLAVLPAASGFRIEPLNDTPARLGGGALKAYYLDTRPLIAEVGRLRTALRERGALPPVWTHGVLPDVAEHLLAALASAWRPEPQVRGARVRLSGERLLCSGFTALHAVAGRKDARHYVDLDTAWQDGGRSVPITRWRIRDAGRSGLWLTSGGTSFEGRAPRPGSLVGVCESMGPGIWQAAVVRWLKRVRPREYAIGVEILGTAHSGVARHGHAFPFAVIFIEPAQGGPVALLAPPGRVAAGRSLRVEMQGREALHLPLERIDRVGGLDRFALAGGLSGQLVDGVAHQGVDAWVGRKNTAAF
ncbi:MAG: hypothetical protein M0Z76_00240 [Gammaproteobacteria bacterium]|nr:hypothetical protein [Gammaproteobacteria bacterium]